MSAAEAPPPAVRAAVLARMNRAFGRRNVGYLWGVLAVAATVPVFDMIGGASRTLGPDRHGGGEMASLILWALGSLIFFGVNALQILGWLIQQCTGGPAASGGRVAHAVLGCALPGVTLLLGYVGVGIHDSLIRRPEPVRSEVAGPQAIGGIAFPPGSVVTTDGRTHRVIGGTAAGPTTIGGLIVVGEFDLSLAGVVERGELSVAQLVSGVPCGPGVFYHKGGRVECVLAETMMVDGVPFAASHPVKMVIDHDGGGAQSGSGVLATRARVGGLDCGPGDVRVGSGVEQCVLARDQEVDGFWLMGGTSASLVHERDGSTRVGDGAVLSAPITVFGVMLPRQTVVVRFPAARLDELRDGHLQPGSRLTLRTPPDAIVPVRDGEVRGQMDIEFSGGNIEISESYQGNKGVFLLEGHRVRNARLDGKTGIWQTHRAVD